MPWKQMRTWYVDKRNPEVLYHTPTELLKEVGEEEPKHGSRLPDFIYAVSAMNPEVARKKLIKAGLSKK